MMFIVLRDAYPALDPLPPGPGVTLSSASAGMPAFNVRWAF
jgi:hypothetical protein